MLPRRPSTALALGLVAALGMSGCAPAVPAPPAAARSLQPPLVARPEPPAAPHSGPPSSAQAHTSSAPPAPATTAPPPPATPRPSSPGLSPRPAATARPLATPPPPPTSSRRVANRLQAMLEEFLAAESAPGISATVLYPDGTSWTGVSGLADIEAGLPVTPETAFPIASVSKTFLAALVLELSAEGAFGLEDRVVTFLPHLKLDPAITVRMLLDHTSGLRDYFEHRLIDRALQDSPSRRWSATRALGYIDKPYFDPGTGWHYSNTNYLVLGLLAEQVTGRKLATEIRARFLDPLGLGSVWYQEAEAPRRPLAHGYRLVPAAANTLRPEDLDDGSGVAPFRSVVTAAGGAGSLAADSRDVARWAQALYGGQAIDDESLSIMLAGVDLVAGYRPRVPYGLGVQAVTIAGHQTFGHSGRFLGFRAVMRWLPEERIAIALLSNQSRADLGPLAARMVKVLLPEPGPCACPAVR